MSPGRPSILVLGDVNVDTVILPCRQARYSDKGSQFGWHEGSPYKLFHRPGGAWLMKEILQAALGESEAGESRVVTYDHTLSLGSAPANAPPRLDSLAILTPFPIDPESQESVYRLDPKGVLGSIQDVSDENRPPALDSERQRRTLKFGLMKYLRKLIRKFKNLDASDKPWLVVVQDLHDIFRDLDPKFSIEPFLKGNPHFDPKVNGYTGDGLILWRMSSPLAQGKTWSHVFKTYVGQMIVVTNADYLRSEGVEIRDDTSIEQKTDCLLDQFERHPSIKKLADCSHLIVRFDTGVFHYTNNPEVISLHFHPNPKYHRMTDSVHLGRMVGYMSVLVGALVKGLDWSFGKPKEWIANRIEERVKSKSPSDLTLADQKTRIMLRRDKKGDDRKCFEVIEAGIESGIRLGIVLAGNIFRNGYARVGFEGQGPQPFTKVFTDWKYVIGEDEEGDRPAGNSPPEESSPGVQADSVDTASPGGAVTAPLLRPPPRSQIRGRSSCLIASSARSRSLTETRSTVTGAFRPSSRATGTTRSG